MKNSKNQILFCILFAIFFGCTDNSSHVAPSYILNNSEYQLQLYFYEDGLQRKDYFQSIKPGEKKEVYKDADDGTGKGFPYYNRLDGADVDSIEVVFDSSRKAVHYGFRANGNNTVAILPTDSRSIFNGDAWNLKTLEDKKRKTETEYTYTFTNEDFQNAK